MKLLSINYCYMLIVKNKILYWLSKRNSDFQFQHIYGPCYSLQWIWITAWIWILAHLCFLAWLIPTRPLELFQFGSQDLFVSEGSTSKDFTHTHLSAAVNAVTKRMKEVWINFKWKWHTAFCFFIAFALKKNLRIFCHILSNM